MTDTIGDLPFWQLTFDAQGDTDHGGAADLAAAVAAEGCTDLVMFSHGWNNSQDTARRLYNAWFGQLAEQVSAASTARKVGLVGIFWPSQRWSDEPIPDFQPAAVAHGNGGAAGLVAQPVTVAGTPTLDGETLKGLLGTFPGAAAPLNRMAALLEGSPSTATLAEFKTQLEEFSTLAGGTDVDEDDPVTPRMLEDQPTELFTRYTAALRDSGLTLDAGGGAAGIDDALHNLLHGAKEALRQATYWQMKNRAGVVGLHGLAPTIATLHQKLPDLKVHLVGHSFGARLVSCSLQGVPADGPSPVKAVTLLQGAFSHFAFADPLPLDASRKGALAGMLARIDGPLTVCFSSHDGAVGTFYPLASIAAREDSAAASDRFYRWGGMGHDGAQGVHAVLDSLQPAGPDAHYRFAPGKVLNIDASDVVSQGAPPSGAHSDIVHPELTWVVLKAGKILE